MSLKKFINDESGFTYTLEAILGITLILGTVLFVTGNIPNTAQKTDEHSKVQLVNIGRDALDLVELTPITDIFGSYSKLQGVNRTYTLVADKTFVKPGENVNFTVYYLDTNTTVTETLILEKYDLGFKNSVDWATITGNTTKNFTSAGTYAIRAIDIFPDPQKYSNTVTINVGYYFLDTDVHGIFETGDKNVSGIVYETYNNSQTGVPNLTIQILKDDGTTVLASPTKTNYTRVIENFDNKNNWINMPGSNLTLNTDISYKTEGSGSITVNGTLNFWIKKTNSSYKFNRFDDISFDFFTNTTGEKIEVELSKNNTPDKFIWNNISTININGWNKIKFQLKDPDIIVGNSSIQDVDTINLSIYNISNDNYFFDNLTASAGSFNFIWPISDAGFYYIRAIDGSGYSSNKHAIIYSGNRPADLGVLCCDSVIQETSSVDITLDPNGNKDLYTCAWVINQQFYKDTNNPQNSFDHNVLTISDAEQGDTKVTLTAYVAGDYYIFCGNAGQGGGQPANAAKTNAILVRVLPLISNCIFGDCKPKCSGLNMTNLSIYMDRFVPEYVNYNLYLINPDGTLCRDCPEFQEIINGYPTDEAATVNKLFHLKTISTEYLRELRMVLWYK